MKMKNPLEPAGRTALEASRELLALEPEEKALALRLMAAAFYRKDRCRHEKDCPGERP